MNPTPWIIIDTETTGLSQPIYSVEIAAQRMEGWEPVGEPFRILLNHDVYIEPEAEAVHGYTREYLRKNGVDPITAHGQFHDYCGTDPVDLGDPLLTCDLLDSSSHFRLFHYLKDVLARLPSMTNHQIPEVTPKAWAKARKVSLPLASQMS